MLRDRLQGLNLYLVGMMGAGKTTVGKRLAETLNYRFFDTDAVIEQYAQRSIPEIFASDGEAGFRELETAVLAQLVPNRFLVVATGGGIVTQQVNWSYLQQGIVIWLDVPIAQIYERLKDEATNRPLLQTADPQAQLEHLMTERRSLYAEADLHIIVTPQATPEDTLTQVLNAIPSVLKDPTPPPA